ncbi:pyridoxamine 5'-phosphate oxidase [Streptomyces sp. T12]|nr:pyridoxamine 5'-phosphate oxidase [Streptomyces sp. T12]
MVYDWDPDTRTVRFSTTADRVKVAHLRRDPHAALHVQGDDVRSFALAEGEAELSDVTTVPGDAAGRELLDIVSRSPARTTRTPSCNSWSTNGGWSSA